MPVDYKKYPKNWTKQIVPRILKRAGNRCEFCQVENGITVYSCRINVRNLVNNHYGLKTIWFEDKNEMNRIKDLIKDWKTVKVVLTIAHLDHDESNPDVSDDRLRALCSYCHLNYDAREKVKRKKKGSKQIEIF